jgi:hypothetical protein
MGSGRRYRSAPGDHVRTVEYMDVSKNEIEAE